MVKVGHAGIANSMPAGTLYEYMITPPGGSSGYAPNGNLLSYTDSVNGTWNFGFSGYDALNRLVGGSATGGVYQGLQTGWSYDSFGNRTSETFGGSSPALLPTSSSAQYNANNQVSASSLMSGAGLVYDAAGDVTQDNMNQYRYDADGRVCAVYNGGSVTGYLYDAGGTRVAKGTLAGFDCGSNFTVTSWYIVGPSGEQLTETDGAGNWKHTNVYAAGALIATYEANNTLFALKDWLGTKRVEVGANNNCATAYTSLPFGEQPSPPAVAVSGYNQCPDDATEHHFTGKERDTESGNDYFGARYYNSNTGRFLSPDWSAKEEPVPYAKLDNPQSLNLYSYVLNNPMDKVDPDGHDFWDKLNNVLHGNGWQDTPPPTSPTAPAPPTDVAGASQSQSKPDSPAPQDVYVDGSKPLPPSSPGGQLLGCTTECVGHHLTVTSTDEPTPAHLGNNPHTRQEAADIRTGSPQETDKVLACASSCGATWAQNEYKHPSKKATAGHVHIEKSHPKQTRGDLPPAE
jgi:RHS repeat-associated protein